MQKELMNQTMAMFDSAKKWNAFVELSNMRQSIEREWFLKIKTPLMTHFKKNLSDRWGCESCGNSGYDMRWYLKGFGKNSLALATWWTYTFCLHLEDVSTFNSELVTNRLKDPEYEEILLAFDRIDQPPPDQKFKVLEIRNYHFSDAGDDCPYNGCFDGVSIADLAWYAGNQTDEFVRQIISKVERFTNDQKVTDLLYKLNQEAKKPPQI